MRNRSGTVDTEEEASDLTLDYLNILIVHAKYGYETGGSSQGRKAFFKRLIWLEAMREKFHSIEAPKRRF